MEWNDQSESSQGLGLGKRSAPPPDDHLDYKRLKNSEVDSKTSSLSDFSSDYDFDEDEEDDLDGLTNDPLAKAESLCAKTTYSVLSPKELAVQMAQRIENVRGILQLPPTTVRTLLNHCNWNKEKLLDAYFGGGDAKKLFKDAGIDSPSSQEIQSGSSSSKGGKEECLICFSEMESSDMVGMNCGHKFCKECWRTALKLQIMEQGNGTKITCIAHNCFTLVDDDMLKKLITEKQVLKKINELQVNCFIQTNPSYKWCPGPNCTKAVKARLVNKMNPKVKCECGHFFCVECSGDAHAPLTCELLREWLLKCNLHQNAENENWILSNTKPCPLCKVNIEKNGGCNHITCEQCRHDFCWICFQSWENHNGSFCNQFDGGKSKASSQTFSTFASDRFLFYYNRYWSQQSSLGMERQLYSKIREKITDFPESLTIEELLKEATDSLCESRQTLQFTHVFAYFVEKCNQLEIITGYQNDLQIAVETLSQFLEQINFGESMIDLQVWVLDLFNICHVRRQALIKCVLEGYDRGDGNGGWKFNL